MDLRITPGPLEGTVTPPPSKSLAHRALIAAALAGGFSVLEELAPSQDIQATLRCMEALGAEWSRQSGDTILVSGIRNLSRPGNELPRFDCGESGSTLRFLIPIALAVAGGGVFTGRGRLMERPQKPYFDIFDEKGIFYEQKDGSLTVRGHLGPGEYRLPGNVSSQFVTGLLYALPLLGGDSTIVLTSPLESHGYVDMTLEVLEQFGIQIEVLEDGFAVSGNQSYQTCRFIVEADWSQAAFWYAAGFLGNWVEVGGLDTHSTQGDAVVEDWVDKLSDPGEMDVDVSNCPDLVPPLAVIAALRTGEITYLTNAARLRIKESDRLASVTQVLNALGADVKEGPDFLKIKGRDALTGGVTVDCCNDHRIAMMAAIAATRCQQPVTLLGAECVKKSYPDFWEVYQTLGGVVHVL
ncbi:3-phosphoshikimate 1-carboxyvinyltransferase [uncultured Dysosmobacter sp.]|uniref:3-phosphoshikimate 1-carboxyvinyltransferase n=1 Tax=uncultured Dysosmobacter sp. TaxID=2591384 RepID=UPI0026169C4B|nr:3-phosphoshikimate 1-carboxyvinyltransferase [uncultured Dysosmobacter sp.]